MLNKIKCIFADEGIDQTGVISAESFEIINPHLLPAGMRINSCIVFLVPYKTKDKNTDSFGVADFARSMDYHAFFHELYLRIIPKLNDAFCGEYFFGFCDHSPINEKLAAARAGLGIIGRNSLLINQLYGSYVFIGSLLTTLSLPVTETEIKPCTDCRICELNCPADAISVKGIIKEKCLSYISQKKVKTKEEFLLLKSGNIAWGCDICQNVCPLNKGKKLSGLDYFSICRLNSISEELIASLSDEQFSKYAFSWRGKNALLENLRNLKNGL
ncbi:MAG: 4Fe-4S double cluster binding domain-containing protein [Eubacteriales bacterium]|nr:4Fe-4S double cluster binding domain-containing protein [Eubacteriales bacterium]MDD4421629.1 4Fe-4S double cluster binding domain-containing protein [Eubacteriales bacterium]